MAEGREAGGEGDCPSGCFDARLVNREPSLDDDPVVDIG